MAPGPHFEVLEGYPPDVMAIAAHGRIMRSDYEDVLIPEFRERLTFEEKVKVLLIFGDDFEGYSPGAAWDDARFGLLFMGDIAALAVVTDVDWLRRAVKAFAPFMPSPVAVFETGEVQAARDWLDSHRTDMSPSLEGPPS